MGPVESSLRSILDLIRDGGYKPMAGNPVPIEKIWEANTITDDQYLRILQEMKSEQHAWRNQQKMDEQGMESDMLAHRMTRAGVPQRYVNCPIDETQLSSLAQGRWIYVCGSDVDAVTRKACGLMKGWLRANQFGVALFERSTSFSSAFSGNFNGDDIMSKCTTAGLLLLSGLGSENATGYVCSKLWELLDRRFGGILPMIITTRHPPNELAAHLGDRGDTETAMGIVEMIRSQAVMVQV